MVAHSTVNRVVTGSSPVTGAINRKAVFPQGGGLFCFFPMNTATFKKGADIILEAKLSDYAYIIEEGSVEVSKRKPD